MLPSARLVVALGVASSFAAPGLHNRHRPVLIGDELKQEETLLQMDHSVFEGLETGRARAGPLQSAAMCSALDYWEAHDQAESSDDGKPKVLGSVKIVMSPHHKTGFAFSKNSIMCINKEKPGRGAFLMGYMLPRQEHLGNAKVVHISRDPLQLLVSTYLYNKDIADMKEHEPQIMSPGSAQWAKNAISKTGMLADFMDVRGEESLREHLRRVSVLDGLKIVLLVTLPEWENVEKATAWCKASTSCMEVSLDRLTSSTEKYNSVWRDVFKFVNITPGAKLDECLAMQDVNNPQFRASKYSHHCAWGKVQQTQRTTLEQTCVQLDKELLDGRFVNASINYRRHHDLVEQYGLPSAI